MAVLAKLLFEETPQVSQFREDVPVALNAQISSLMAKEPSQRPKSARTAMTAMDSSLAGATTVAVGSKSTTISTAEREVVSVLLLGPTMRRGVEESRMQRVRQI